MQKLIILCKRVAFFIVVLFYSTFIYGQNKTISYTDAINLTLKHSKYLVVSELQVKVAKGNLLASKGLLNTQLLGDISYINHELQDNYFSNQTSYSGYTAQYLDYSFGVVKKMSFGTELSAGITLRAYGNDSLYQAINNIRGGYGKTAKGNLYVNVEQPLFKYRGGTYNLYSFNTAKTEYSLTELSNKADISLALYETLMDYLNCIYYKIYSNIQVKTLTRYELVYEQLNYLVNMDAIPQADLTYLNALIASQRSYIKESALEFKQGKEDLAKGIGLAFSELENFGDIEENFIIENVKVPSGNSYLKTCMEYMQKYRFDIQIIELQNLLKRYDITRYNNLIKPELNLKAGVGYNGIYQSNNFDRYYKPLTANIPGVNYNVGMSMKFNPKNSEIKGELIKAKAENEQIMELKEATILEAKSEIRKSFYEITMLNEIAQNNKEVLQYIEKALENEYTKLKLGSSTILNLVQLQLDYNEYLIEHEQTLLKLNKSIINFRYLTGTIIKVNEDNSLHIDYQNLFNLPNFN